MSKLKESIAKTKTIASRLFKIVLWLCFLSMFIISLFYFDIIQYVDDKNSFLILIDIFNYNIEFLVKITEKL